MKILGTEWFTLRTGTLIGITTTENEAGERKSYIGVGVGMNEKLDEMQIAEWGSPVMAASLKSILNRMEAQ